MGYTKPEIRGPIENSAASYGWTIHRGGWWRNEGGEMLPGVRGFAAMKKWLKRQGGKGNAAFGSEATALPDAELDQSEGLRQGRAVAGLYPLADVTHDQDGWSLIARDTNGLTVEISGAWDAEYSRDFFAAFVARKGSQ